MEDLIDEDVEEAGPEGVDEGSNELMRRNVKAVRKMISLMLQTPDRSDKEMNLDDG